MRDSALKMYPGWIRLILAASAVIAIIFTFYIMSRLSVPSVYINAVSIVKSDSSSAGDISRLSFLNFKNFLYLNGPVSPAFDSENTHLFQLSGSPAVLPSTFSDKTGAVEVLSPKVPLTDDDPSSYYYNESYHFLGWRTGKSGFSLFAVGKTKDSLLSLLENKARGWKTSLLINGFLLSILVFAIFWLLNTSLLSTPYLEAVQILIINVVFLVLFYSVLLLTGYPLPETLLTTLFILLMANTVFIPLALYIRKKGSGFGLKEE